MSDIDISEPLSDLLAPLNNEQREFLMNNYTIQTYKKNETIYCEGETPSHLMCLITGKVKIFKDGVGGRSQIIRMIKQREYFAYRAYFAKEDFVTAAAAFEPSVICLIPMTAITTLVAQNNDLAMFFIRQLSIDLGISDERTVSLTQKHIRGRLAESLIFLKESYGLEEDGSTLSIYLSREDLANLSNMTIPKARKREIRKNVYFILTKGLAEHQRRIGSHDPAYLKRLIGSLCYWRSIEPDNTYVADSIAALKRLQKGY
mgnify:CR=1 FL=1